MAVMDTSVLVAVINSHEPGHISSFNWFSNILSTGVAVSAPVILLAETAAAISRGQNDPERAYRAIRLLTETDYIMWYPVNQALAFRSAEIAADYKIRGCDAIFVALAEQLGEELVTLDNEQLTRSTAVISARRP